MRVDPHERVETETSVERFHSRSVMWDTPIAKRVGEGKGPVQVMERNPPTRGRDGGCPLENGKAANSTLGEEDLGDS